MATYSNQHWLLSHIRNSFVSTDDTGICETVMQSDDLPKHYLRKFQTDSSTPSNYSYRKSNGAPNGSKAHQSVDRPLQEVDFVCYPGLDYSDDEDIDLTAQSFDIQMYPEVGAHRFRSNTAQKLEKMDIARRKAARTKCINFDDEIVAPEANDFFVRKEVGKKISSRPGGAEQNVNHKESELSKAFNAGNAGPDDVLGDSGVKSKLSLQLANSPKQSQNKFMEYARFDGTSQTGIQTKRINVFLNMLPERERNYPIKICVLANAKILEVIGLICYKATIQFPEIPLKSIRHYALYMTEDNDDMDDFPPLDNREPCSKFGFSHLTLAERRPLVPVTRIEYNNTLTSNEDKARLAAAAVRSLQNIQINGDQSINEHANELTTTTTTPPTTTTTTSTEEQNFNEDDEATLSHNDMLEAPLYRTYRLHMIDKRFFKTEVTLGISGERIEIDQQKHAKFWSKQKAVTYLIDAVGHVEIVERRNAKATLRIYLKSSSSSSTGGCLGDSRSGSSGIGVGPNPITSHSPTSPGGHSGGHQLSVSPFNFFSNSMGNPNFQHQHSHYPHSHHNHHPHHHHHHHHLRFKHYDFEAPIAIAEHILNKLNCILEVRSSEARREFLSARERKMEKHSRKHLKM